MGYQDDGPPAPWGSTVLGVDEGGGWLRVGSLFLPMAIRGKQVIVPMESAQGSIVSSQTGRTWWGFPNYLHDMDTGLLSWEELARIHGHLGLNCSAETVLEQCGRALVCKASVCGSCAISRDCGEKYKCETFQDGGRSLCIQRDLSQQWGWREVVCTILIIITAVLSAAAGMGGGGVYVPLLLLLLGFSAKEAVPLSQAMIVGGATVNVIMFCGERHPKHHHRPKIDYDVIMMLNPGLAAGVTIGVMLHVVSPQWLITMVLLVTLAMTLEKSFVKGLKEWRKESKAIEERRAAKRAGAGAKQGEGVIGVKLKFTDIATFAVLAGSNPRPLSLIFGCWAAFLVSNLLKAPQCTTMYWMQLLGMLVICFVFTMAGARTVVFQKQGASNSDDVIAWTPTTLWFYPLLSTCAGFLGGFLGIGGGIIMGPLLLELGMVPEASQATTAMFVFLSSSLATFQFIVLGKAMPEYAFWFTSWVLVATIVGQTLVDYILQRWQRASLIVLSIAAIIAGSLLMMTAIGFKDVVTDILRGADMGFMPRNLCK